MAEPKKETVRIALPPRPEQAASTPDVAKPSTARIVLPTRTPITPIRRPPPKITSLPAPESAAEQPVVLPRRPPVAPQATSPLLQPLPKPPGIAEESGAGAVTPSVQPDRTQNSIAPSINRGPKKETARISVLPRPVQAAPGAINMTKTQPLLVHPTATAPVAPVVITSRPLAPVEAIPKPLCWGLLGISTVIFLIQIWNYVVS